MTYVQQVGFNRNLAEQINFKQNPKNVSKVNFKNNDRDSYNTRQVVYTQPPMYDRNAAIIAQQDKEQKKQKIKNGVVTGLTIAAMLAIIVAALPSIKSLFGKNGVNGMVWTKEQADATEAVSKKIHGIEERHIDCYCDELKNEINSIKTDLKRKDYKKKGEKFGYFIQLAGPGGTGKSDSAERIALMVQKEYAGSEFFVPDLSVLTSSGISGQNVALVEQYAKNLCIRLDQLAKEGKKGVVFLDEIDRIAMQDHSLSAAHSNQSIGSLKTLLDIIKTKENVIVISATNYPEKIEGAVGSRMSKKIYVDYLNSKQILRSTIDWYKKVFEKDNTAVSKELTDIANKKLIEVTNILGNKDSQMTWRIWEDIRHGAFRKSDENGAITINNYLDAVIENARGASSDLKLSDADINKIIALKA